MTKLNLVIVESPAKCLKIGTLLGANYKCCASYGHIYVLDKNIKNIIKNITRKKHIKYNIDKNNTHISNLLKLSHNKNIIIATDSDREGEAIGFHLVDLLKLNYKNITRITFDQITQNALDKSIKSPTKLNMNLYKAQQTRAILDLIFGYTISPILWKYIRNSLSAGRCQSPALRLLIDRENEIKKHKYDLYYTVNGILDIDKKYQLNIILDKKLTSENETKLFLNKVKKSHLSIESIDISNHISKPPIPFTTSSLIQEASSKLSMSPKQCNTLAQKLYESGLITYIRTDSLKISDEFKNSVKIYIEKNIKKKFIDKSFVNKNKFTQESHESIHVTNINISKINLSKKENILYNLIWKRSIACLMSDHIIKETKIVIRISESNDKLIGKINEIIDMGYKEIYNFDTKNINDINILKELNKNSSVKLNTLSGIPKYNKHSGRYSESGLVKALENHNIGRPSTYSNIISVIQNRGYVEKKTLEGETEEFNEYILKNNTIKSNKIQISKYNENNKLFVTDIGYLVNDFMIKHLEKYVNYQLTADIELELDKIANGKSNWHNIILKYYNTLLNDIKKLNPQKHSLKNKLYNLYPIKIGLYKNSEVQLNKGRFGFYLTFKGNNFSIKHYDQDKFTLEKAIERIKNHKIYYSKKFKDNIYVRDGKYGSYISYNNKNYSLKKTKKNFKKLTFKDIKKIIEI